MPVVPVWVTLVLSQHLPPKWSKEREMKASFPKFLPRSICVHMVGTITISRMYCHFSEISPQLPHFILGKKEHY